MNRVSRSFAIPLLLACATPALSQVPSTNIAGTVSAGHTVPVPSARAARRSTAITLDGNLDDAAWQAATPVTEFTQTDPTEGQPATQRTEMRFLFDEGALYVGAKMYDTQGRAGVRTSLIRRDGQFNSDFMEVVIDGFHDHLGRAFFQVNPSGSKFDMLGIGTSCCDSGWDPIWEAATRIDDDGWSAELRIPLSQLKFSAAVVADVGPAAPSLDPPEQRARPVGVLAEERVGWAEQVRTPRGPRVWWTCRHAVGAAAVRGRQDPEPRGA